MRLEIDTTVSAPPLANESDSQNNASVDSAEMKSALNQGIKAAQAGNRAQARTSLLHAVELDPRSESGWLWLASISEYPEELLGFLNNVLDINPENQRALEWKSATHTLLAKTFVQRGVDASQENRKEFATECFQKALDYDDRNCAAWIWMASLSESPTVKISFLEKVLAVEPDNEEAAVAIEEARNAILKNRLVEAKSAAVAGNNADAIVILDNLLVVAPNAVEAWVMKSHLAEGFDEKIRCFESILAIDPENVAARAGRDSLLAIFGTADAAEVESTIEEIEPAVVFEEVALDSGLIEDLEMPAEILSEIQVLPDVQTPTTPEAEDENEKQEVVAEPFASFAEETPAPYAEESGSNDVVEVEDEQVYADPQAETVVFTYAPEADAAVKEHSETRLWWQPPVAAEAEASSQPVVVAEREAHVEPEMWTVPDVPAEFEHHSGPASDPAIAMPFDELPEVESENTEAVVTAVEADSELVAVKPDLVDCPFCHQTNDPQAISCHSCLAVLTLSDLELLLANQNADKLRLRQAVEGMERRRLSGALDSDELVTLGVGHLNLRNLQLGYSCLADAAQLNPNNVVLGRQVNSLLIRLEEIKQQEEAQLKMPKGKSILVVDDSPTVRKLIAGKLEKCGHEVICASDGVEAMERLAQFVPDLVLLDITMPRMDGYQVCKQIRSGAATRDVAVVMISGKDGFFDKVRGRMAGTTGYITKPFGPETLMKAVEMYLSGEAPELNDEEA